MLVLLKRLKKGRKVFSKYVKEKKNRNFYNVPTDSKSISKSKYVACYMFICEYIIKMTISSENTDYQNWLKESTES